MKRFAIKDYGPAREVFEEIETTPKELTGNHIRVAIKAFAINPYDVSLRQGKMQDFRSLKFPYVLGNDGGGIVTEVAEDVTNLRVGDRVVLHPIGGAYGEEISLPAHKAAKLPDKMSWQEAAGMVTTGITAYNILFHLLSLHSEDVVMVEGASGGVGSLLVQLLKQKGHRVLTSASKHNEGHVRQWQVDGFAAYDQEDPGTIFENQADVVIDATKGSRGIEAGVRIMKENGTYVALNTLPTEEQRVKKGKYLHFGPSKEYSDQEAFTALLAAYEKGQLEIEIAEVLPFELASVILAHEKMEGHPPAGKIILAKESFK